MNPKEPSAGVYLAGWFTTFALASLAIVKLFEYLPAPLGGATVFGLALGLLAGYLNGKLWGGLYARAMSHYQRSKYVVEEFDCIGCGVRVHNFSAMPSPRRLCTTCLYIERIPDPIERARVREELERSFKSQRLPRQA
jgi:hypothetical protein